MISSCWDQRNSAHGEKAVNGTICLVQNCLGRVNRYDRCGHHTSPNQCPLCSRKRTDSRHLGMLALCLVGAREQCQPYVERIRGTNFMEDCGSCRINPL